MGYKAIRSKGFEGRVRPNGHEPKHSMSNRQAFISGFLTNLLNPKATLFFLAVFSQFITVGTTVTQQLILGTTCVVMTWIWFTVVVIVLTDNKVRRTFLKASKWIDRICGGLFIALGVRLATTKGVAP